MADYVRNEENKSVLLAKQVSIGINSFSFSEKDFCTTMRNEHRTLQQNFTRLCLEWLKTCSKPDYATDGRNQASHDVAKQIVDAVGEDLYVPFI